MSGSNHLTQIRSVILGDKHDLMDIASDAGTHSTEAEDAVVLTITIEKGELVKHVAKDRDGKILKTSSLRIHSDDEGTVCFVCWQLDGDYGRGYCRRMPCHLM